MTLKSKLCGFSNLKSLQYAIDHPYSPALIGFIVNFPKSKRYVEPNKLETLLNVDKKKSSFVAVLVKPDNEILEKIKDLPFDYYQIYDCGPDRMKFIKKKYNKKIISALTVENKDDVENCEQKCSFQYHYGLSSTNITNEGQYLSIEYDSNNQMYYTIYYT